MEQDEEKETEAKRSLNNYARFTGLGFQMMAIIGVFTFIGYKMDHWLELAYPIFTIVFILLAVFTSMYSIIKSLK